MRFLCIALALAGAACGQNSPPCGPATLLVGEACSSSCDCTVMRGATLCLQQRGVAWPGGYCSSTCANDEDCGTFGVCGEPQFFGVPEFRTCLRTCPTGTECRTGYACRTAPAARDGGPPRTGCVPVGLGGDAGAGG